MITILSRQPKCKYCKELMISWHPFINFNEQSHPQCEGKMLAKKSFSRLKIGDHISKNQKTSNS